MDKYICPKLPNIFVQFSISAAMTSPPLVVQLPEIFYHRTQNVFVQMDKYIYQKLPNIYPIFYSNG